MSDENTEVRTFTPPPEQPPVQVTDEMLSDDEIIKFTRRMRMSMLLGSTVLPTGVDEKLALETMRDLDRNALANKKIASDDNNSEKDRVTARAIAEYHMEVSTNPFLGKRDKAVEPDASLLPPIDIVPDQTSTELSTMEYSEERAEEIKQSQISE